jgi:hypothetical protein
MDPRSLTDFFQWLLSALDRNIVEVVLFGQYAAATKRQAWTAQQKWYAIDLKRKSPDKKLDDIILAIKTKHDRDVSA